MLRRQFLSRTLALGLVAVPGCMSFDHPWVPRLRGLGAGGPCPPGMVCDSSGPIMSGPVLDYGEPLTPESGTIRPGVSDGVMPQPRLMPQPMNPTEPPPTPYVPTKGTKAKQ